MSVIEDGGAWDTKAGGADAEGGSGEFLHRGGPGVVMGVGAEEDTKVFGIEGDLDVMET